MKRKRYSYNVRKGSKIEDSAGLGVFVCVGGGGGEFEKKRAKKCKKT